MNKKILSSKLLILIFILLLNSTSVFASQLSDPNLEAPYVVAKSALLIDEDSGKVLYSKNENERVYPASLTKLLTLIIAREYIDEDEIVVIGDEINQVPWDSSKAGHVVGESILGINLFRGLIIPSGNETANVVAMYVAREVTGKDDISYKEAEKVFAEVMNEKAKELGCTDSNFVTPSGYHDDNHYTTAHDMMLIMQEAMKDDLIREIVSEKEFKGNGAGDKATPDMITQDYDWVSHNSLLRSNDYVYPYATGMKTGYTSEAEGCLAASATKGDENLLCVVFYSPDPYRWEDTISLFDYGFNNYGNVDIQNSGDVTAVNYIDNPMLGESDELELVTTEDEKLFLNDYESDSLSKEIVYNEDLISENTTEDGEMQLKTPIEKGQTVGEIVYSVYGEEVYRDNLVSTRDVGERTFKTDASYYWGKTKEFVTSWKMIPTTIIFIVVLGFIIRNVNKYRRKRRRGLHFR